MKPIEHVPFGKGGESSFSCIEAIAAKILLMRREKEFLSIGKFLQSEGVTGETLVGLKLQLLRFIVG